MISNDGAANLELSAVLMGFLTTAEVAVCIADQDSNIIYANPAMAVIFNAPSASDLIGRNIFDHMDDVDEHLHSRDAWKYLERTGGRYLKNSQVTCRDFHGDEVTIMVNHRRFWELPGPGDERKLYMGCTINRPPEEC